MRFLANENMPGDAIAALVNARDDWAGRFAVIEPGRVRMRDLARAVRGQ